MCQKGYIWIKVEYENWKYFLFFGKKQKVGYIDTDHNCR